MGRLSRTNQQILVWFERMYPEATTDLVYHSPFELLVATVLSAQTTDSAVNSVTPVLFQRYPTAVELSGANAQDVGEIIKRTGFYNVKARSIITLSNQLLTLFAGEVPHAITDLVQLAGVGRKTANVVRSDAFGYPGLTIDTHFGRIARRLGWSSEKDPAKVESDVGRRIPRSEWSMLSHRVIAHGRRICHARRPACGVCALSFWCPSKTLGVSFYSQASRQLSGTEEEKSHLIACYASAKKQSCGCESSV